MLTQKANSPYILFLEPQNIPESKQNTRPHVAREYEPVGELTKLGWLLMAPGKEFDCDVMLLTQTSQADYEQLSRLDVLGLEDLAENDQQTLYTESAIDNR